MAIMAGQRCPPVHVPNPMSAVEPPDPANRRSPNPRKAGLAELHAKKPPSSDLASRAGGDDPPPPPRRDPRTLPPRLGQPLASAPATCYKGGVALAAEATASDPGAPRVDRGADKSLAATFLDGRAGSPVSPSGSGKLMGGGGGWCGGARVSNELGVKMTKVSKVNTIYQ